MIGVVLCGGQSTRMGSDKGLLKQADKTFLEFAYAQLSKVVPKVVVSVNEDQLSSYIKAFPGFEFIVDQSKYKGPLNGIMTVYNKYPKANLLVVPCDMLKVNSDLLAEIISTESQVYNNGDVQPFPGWYTNDLLGQIAQTELDRFSMKFIIERFKVRQINTKLQEEFFNANSPDDLI